MYQWIHLVLADKLAYDGCRLNLVSILQQLNHMKNLTVFTFITETALASIGVGMLWLSPWSLLIKISLSCLIFLHAISRDLQGLQHSMQAELQLEVLDIGIRAIEQRLTGDNDVSFAKVSEEHLKQKAFLTRISGGGSAYIASLLIKYGIWLAGSTITYWLILPLIDSRVTQW